MTAMERIELNGIPYIKPFLVETSGLIVLSLAGLIVRPARDKYLFVFLFFSMLTYTVYVGGDAFGNWRFLAPFVPFAFLALLSDIIVLGQLFGNLLAPYKRHNIAIVIIYFILLIGFFMISRPGSYFTNIQQFSITQNDNRAQINTAIYLKKILKLDASVGVTYAGAIPFYTGFYSIDFLGKSDRYIALRQPRITNASSGQKSMPGHNKYDLKYSVLQKRPTFVSEVQWGKDNVTALASRLYVAVPVGFRTWPPYNPKAVLLLENSPHVWWDCIKAEPLHFGPK